MPQSEGSFIRWQSIAIQQLGYTTNLILALSTAALGFAVTVVRDEPFTSSPCGRCLLVLCCTSLVLSFISGLLCSVTRLKDFRKTKDIARIREAKLPRISGREEIEEELKRLRAESKRLGKWTWGFLWFQLGSFGVGGAFLVAYLG